MKPRWKKRAGAITKTPDGNEWTNAGKAPRSYRLKENAFGSWVIMHPENDQYAWTGSKWARMDEYGLPAGDTQISNFPTEAEARIYADEHVR